MPRTSAVLPMTKHCVFVTFGPLADMWKACSDDPLIRFYDVAVDLDEAYAQAAERLRQRFPHTALRPFVNCIDLAAWFAALPALPDGLQPLADVPFVRWPA